MKIKYILFFVLLSPAFYTLNAQNNNQGKEKFNWQTYDNRSSVIKDSINYNLLQGNWMSQTERRILAKYNYDYDIKIKSKYYQVVKYLQIRGDEYRNTVNGDFKLFRLDKNLIIFSGDDNRADSAYINLITEGELTICFKKGEDFYQYEFKK